jgi:DNA-directed RNA polymerase subunit beta'
MNQQTQNITQVKAQAKTMTADDFDKAILRLASPQTILEWSFGEVLRPETINYRTQRSERGGLFDEKVFGPEKDYECYCGKYRGIRYKGIVCEKCGVEVTRSIVRRERMGHIELATPVSHIWFLKNIPSRVALLLGITASSLEKVVYFAGYIVISVDQKEKERMLREVDVEFRQKMKSLGDDKTKEALKERFSSAKKEIESLTEGQVLDDATYHRFSLKYGTAFEANIGAEAIYEFFKKIDLDKLVEKTELELEKVGAAERPKVQKRLSLAKAMRNSKIRPEWMFLTHVPVIPPALRPMVALDGGRHATSDVNDLYRRVINRNNRLKKLMEINAPDVILRNEKRILQEAVDALIDNSMRKGSQSYSAMSQAQRRPLKSLSANLKGKQGLFRQNLLGKRVDYSGRSVIVVGPDIYLNQCGLPKHMALELFRPFVIAKLLQRELAYNIRGAGRLIDDGIDEVWAILEEVIKGKYVLLNRAPTLHRLGIQAFQPVLIEGNAIQVHPLVCAAFNADFDGDQMAVHVPLSDEAQLEAREIMASDKNLLKPGDGEPVISIDRLDIVLGCYWMTKIIEGDKGEGKIFSSPNSAITAHDFGEVTFRARIKVLGTESEKYAKFNQEPFETSVGRLLFNSVLPKDFPYVNEEVERKTMSAVVDELVEKYGTAAAPSILDKIKRFGFKYATYSGTTWGIDDIKEPEGKQELIDAAMIKKQEVDGHYDAGLLSVDERKRKNIEIWQGLRNQVEALMPGSLDPNGSVYDMLKSGARGSINQITNMAGLKGLIAGAGGQTIEFPILSSSKQGLTPIEYFTTTHGSRKGLADTALQTAKAGYLTRRLFDVAQDAIITENDCGTNEGVIIRNENLSGIQIPISKNIKGRYLLKDVVAPDGKVLFKKGTLLRKEQADQVEKANVEMVEVRSPMTCKSLRGICQNCYGIDLGSNEPVDLGEAVGTVAAQAIGEPGTQLTMRTFHAGGTAIVGGDITQGLPRVEEIFERRMPKNPAVVSRVDGTVTNIETVGKEKVIKVLPEIEHKSKSKNRQSEVEYLVNFRRVPLVEQGQKVKKGQILTDGSVNIPELFKYGGKEKAQDYIISEINKIYELQGATISRKHVEVIIRQMFSRRKIKDEGGTGLTPGDIVELPVLIEANNKAKENGLKEAVAEPLVTGITEVSLSRQSFFSAASFQNTTRILINAALRGSVDRLVGLKENVILGKLIPAGSGFAGSQKHRKIQELQKELDEKYS